MLCICCGFVEIFVMFLAFCKILILGVLRK
jgi:hypothetical protein